MRILLFIVFASFSCSDLVTVQNIQSVPTTAVLVAKGSMAQHASAQAETTSVASCWGRGDNEEKLVMGDSGRSNKTHQ